MKESRLKVLTVINYKGGVGKTTVVAGLAAYFTSQGKRVLIIDFDYQGSLTRMMILGARLPLGSSIRADNVIGGEIDGDGLGTARSRPQRHAPRSKPHHLRAILRPLRKQDDASLATR